MNTLKNGMKNEEKTKEQKGFVKEQPTQLHLEQSNA